MDHVPRIPPPAAAVGAALVQRALSDGTRPRTKGRTVGAVTISLVSFAMAGAAARRFRQSGTTFEPFQPDRASVLVTSGANAISRNPMYVGMAGLLLAHAVWRTLGARSFHWSASSSSSTAPRYKRRKRRSARSSGPHTRPTWRGRPDR